MQISEKHHYLPVFYLKRWTKANGKLCQFSRPYTEVKPKRVVPDQTGYVRRLYETKGLAPENAQRVEQEFLKPVDTLAARALELLENGDSRIDLDVNVRTGWSRFLLSLLVRSPDDIITLKDGVVETWDEMIPDFESKYNSIRTSGDPSSLDIFCDQHAMSLFLDAINCGPILHAINSMIWFFGRISGNIELMTSDRPLLMPPTLREQNAYLLLPTGPKTFFVAVNDLETQRMFQDQHSVELVYTINEQITSHAVKYVYASDDRYLDFVRQYLSTRPQRSPLRRLFDSWRQRRP